MDTDIWPTVYISLLDCLWLYSVMMKKQKAVERVNEQLDKLLLQQTDKVC